MDDNQIGYGKPPKHTRFRKGRSGNPKGRPKGRRNMAKILEEMLSQPVLVKRNGREQRVAFREAYMHKLMSKTLEGSPRDMVTLLKALHDYFPEALQPESQPLKELTIRFVDSDGDGGLPEWERERLEQEEAEARRPKRKRKKARDRARADDAALEAAWKASGIDDDPTEAGED